MESGVKIGLIYRVYIVGYRILYIIYVAAFYKHSRGAIWFYDYFDHNFAGMCFHDLCYTIDIDQDMAYLTV